LRLASPDYRAAPVIDLNYLEHAYDRRILLAAMRFARRIGETGSMRGICVGEIHPGPEVQSDDEWQSYIESTCETVYHPCGTAAIGCVVTPDLRVISMDNLWIADASIFPALITTNINCAVMMAAEKAADLIRP
jgi:choline dehydrogenase-like flavoprotein